ncbi:MAG: AAA family ATPase [Parachlamydiales bacterium]
MKRLAVFGTHGAAKTTLVYKLAAYYKMKDKNVTVIHETARLSPFPINLKAVYQTTLFIVSAQLQKELMAEAQGFEIAISDMTLSDAFIYINYLKRGNEFTKSLEEFCLQWIKKYDLLVYVEPIEASIISSDGIRETDKNFQLAIRNEFRIFVKKIEELFRGKIHIIKAESNQVFDDKQCLKLLENINRSLYE